MFQRNLGFLKGPCQCENKHTQSGILGCNILVAGPAPLAWCETPWRPWVFGFVFPIYASLGVCSVARNRHAAYITRDLFLESTNQSELQRSKHSNELEVLEAVIKVDPKTQACHHSVCNFTVSFMFWSGHLRFVCCLHSWTAEKVLRGTCCVVVISARIAGFRGSWGFNSPLSLEIFGKMDQSP